MQGCIGLLLALPHVYVTGKIHHQNDEVQNELIRVTGMRQPYGGIHLA